MPAVRRKRQAREGHGSLKAPPSLTKKRSQPRNTVMWIIAPALILGVIAMVVFAAEKLFLGPLVNTPLDLPPAVAQDWNNATIYQRRLWGTYRSNVYLGMRPRIPRSLLSGLMWFAYDGEFSLRHTCEHGDRLQRYGWIRHDGTSFGQQEITDSSLTLSTDFISLQESSLGESWTVRLSARPRVPRPVLASFIFYVYNEGAGEMDCHVSQRHSVEEVFGYTPEFREFRVYFPKRTSSKDEVHSYLRTRRSSVTDLAGFVKSIMKMTSPRKSWPTIAVLPGEFRSPEDTSTKPNLIAYQVTATLPFEMDMVFETGMFSAALSISGDRFTSTLATRTEQFDQRFEETFQLQAKKFGESEVTFAKAAFSNLIGGISYFHGQSIVTSNDLTQPVLYWPASLYTAVPSRSFFPRGFLWDEGFHQLLIANWDTSITMDVLAHWLDLLNIEGWIPREQILGDEARSKVPAEFVVQHSENANPPTFFLTMEMLLEKMQSQDSVNLAYLRRVYPRLQVWFEWFNTTQLGLKPTSYRWRGRNETTTMELNPKTLTSGLDDYPRASHPSPEEYHVDLRCWIALASGVLAKMADILGEDSKLYRDTHTELTDQKLLDRLHWDTKRKMYSDYGLHTPAVKLVRVPPSQPNMPSFKRRKVLKLPSLRFVNSFGYVNLFPFLLKIVSPSSEKLGYILDRLRNESLLWTPYGLRSLSKKDPIYNKHNTEHDPPYWRGAIWLNMNYLAVRALHHYGNAQGPYRQHAQRLYTELRSNLIRNLHDQYMKTGYIWEQYDDDIGRGKGTHPFTGWSSLIVLIMAEKY